jgi:hypothetical protein
MVDTDIVGIVKSRMSVLVDVLQTPNIYVVSKTHKVRAKHLMSSPSFADGLLLLLKR